MKKKDNILKKIANKAYEFGFVSKIKTDIIESGLNEDVIRLISKKKNEPSWLLEFRLEAYRHWLTLKMPTWAHLNIPPIDYQAISYYADPLKKSKEKNKEIDPELMKTFEKLGIPLEERLALSGTAVDAVMDSVSVKTTFKEELKEKGRKAWNDVLSRIEVEGGNLDQYRTFYSCLYRATLFPQKHYEIDANGEVVHYSPHNGKVEKGYFYTGTGFWDTFRCLFPLLNIV